MKILQLYFLIIFVTLIGCKKENITEFTDTPIITSYLEPGSYFTLNVSRQIPFSSQVQYSKDDINNLPITILYNNSNHLLKPLGNGSYIDSSTVVAAGTNYNLSFLFNSKNVSAYTYIPSKPLNFTQSTTVIIIARVTSTSGRPATGAIIPDPITLTWGNPDASNYLIVVENTETVLNPIRNFGSNAVPQNRFRQSPTNSTTAQLNSREFQYYGHHRVILFHVLPDYSTLYDQSNTTSQNLANPSTSIINGYGIFTGLNSDTLYVQVDSL